jgi:hypothetical protein
MVSISQLKRLRPGEKYLAELSQLQSGGTGI